MRGSYPKQLHLIQLDNGRWHIWSELNVPDNIILFFQPPYSPQVNPIERLWKEIKKPLKWELFDNLDRLREKLSQVLSKLTDLTIASVTGWDFILDALFVDKHLSISYYVLLKLEQLRRSTKL